MSRRVVAGLKSAALLVVLGACIEQDMLWILNDFNI
jgi:hypothetical protein